jgi:hypothetical protein
MSQAVPHLLIAVGLGIGTWPAMLSPPEHLSPVVSQCRSVLCAVSLLSLLGIRYPLRMVPLLLFELLWKSIWALAFGLPLWPNQQLDANTRFVLIACLLGIVLTPLVLPWGYVASHYLKAPGDRWGAHRAAGKDA